MDNHDATSPIADPQMLIAYLANRDVPCPLCGYNLRGLMGGRCPECGEELRLQVGLVEPKLGWFIGAVVGCCLGLGGSALFIALALAAAPSEWLVEEPSGWMLLAMLVITGLLLPVLLVGQRRFRQLPVIAQRVTTACIWFTVLFLSWQVIRLFND